MRMTRIVRNILLQVKANNLSTYLRYIPTWKLMKFHTYKRYKMSVNNIFNEVVKTNGMTITKLINILQYLANKLSSGTLCPCHTSFYNFLL